MAQATGWIVLLMVLEVVIHRLVPRWHNAHTLEDSLTSACSGILALILK